MTYGFGGKGTSQAAGYGQAASSMGAAGVSGVGGGSAANKSSSGKSTGSTSSGSGSRAAGGAADRGSVAGYSGGTGTSKGQTSSGAGSRAAGGAADRGSVAGYSGTAAKGGTGTTGSGGMAAARAADRASVSNYAGKTSTPTGTTPDQARTRMSDRMRETYGIDTPSTGYTPDLSKRSRMDSVWGANAPVPTETGRVSVPTGFKSDAATRTALSKANTIASVADRMGVQPASPTANEPTGFAAALQAGISNDYNAAVARSAQQEVSNPLASGFRAAENKSMSDLERQVMANGLETYGPLTGAYTSPLEAGRLNIGGKFGNTGELGKVVNAITTIESAGDPKAKNPDTTATGLGQFTEKTWLGMIDRYHPEMKNLSRDAKLAKRNDPALSQEMTYNYALENGRTLKAAGVDITPTSLYAAHFLGPDSAVKAYKADPTASAISVLGADKVASNKSIMQGKSIGQVLGTIDDKMMAALDVPTDTQVAGTDIPAPATGATTTTTPTPRSNPDASVYGNTPGGIKSGPTPAEPMSTIQKAGSFATKTGLAVFGGIPGAIATGVDLLAEMATGQGFIDRMWASTDNPGGANSSVGKAATWGRSGGGPTMGDASGPSVQTPKSALGTSTPTTTATTATADATDTSFESKYLNDTGRPTPEQKWDWTSSKYIGVANAPSV